MTGALRRFLSGRAFNSCSSCDAWLASSAAVKPDLQNNLKDKKESIKKNPYL
jgi:hypothetical protein